MVKIYALLHPETGEIRYIGKTEQDLGNRLSGHLTSSKRRNHPVNQWISCLDDKPLIRLIEKVNKRNWREAEKSWIWYFQCKLECKLLNVAEGGAGGAGRPYGYNHSEETKEKIKNQLKGNNNPLGCERSENTKKKIAAAFSGRDRSGIGGKRAISKKQEPEVRRLYCEENMTYQEIAEIFDVGYNTIGRVIRGDLSYEGTDT